MCLESRFPSRTRSHCWSRRGRRRKRDPAARETTGRRPLAGSAPASQTCAKSPFRHFGEMAASGGMRHLGCERFRRKARVGSGPTRAMKASARYGSIRQKAATVEGCQTVRDTSLSSWEQKRRDGRLGLSDLLSCSILAAIRADRRTATRAAAPPFAECKTAPADGPYWTSGTPRDAALGIRRRVAALMLVCGDPAGEAAAGRTGSPSQSVPTGVPVVPSPNICAGRSYGTPRSPAAPKPYRLQGGCP